MGSEKNGIVRTLLASGVRTALSARTNLNKPVLQRKTATPQEIMRGTTICIVNLHIHGWPNDYSMRVHQRALRSWKG